MRTRVMMVGVLSITCAAGTWADAGGDCRSSRSLDVRLQAYALAERYRGEGFDRSDREALAHAGRRRIRLGLAVLKYARHARGGRVDAVQSGQTNDHKPTLIAPKTVLNAIGTAEKPRQLPARPAPEAPPVYAPAASPHQSAPNLERESAGGPQSCPRVRTSEWAWSIRTLRLCGGSSA